MDPNPELLAVFRDEVSETLDELAIALEALREDGSAEHSKHLDAAFRHAHNLKGAARMVGHDTVVHITHAMEDVLSGFRESGDVFPAQLAETMLKALTLISRAVEGENQDAAAEAIVASLRGAPSEGEAATRNAHAEAAPDQTVADEPVPASSENAAAVHAESASVKPASDANPAGGAGNESSAAEAPAEIDVPSADVSVRVELSRLDRLMGYTGELLLAHAGQTLQNESLGTIADDLRQVCRELPAEVRGPVERLSRDLEDLVAESRKELRTFGYLTDEINTAMKRVRMLPLSSLGAQWRRIVREAAQETGKPVNLHLDVGDIEVDKHVLDSLRDPIMHLLRNAVSHGIEAPEARAQSSKPAAGQVTVKARMVGSRVQVSVADDGRGIDPQRIASSALAKGAVDEQELKRLDDEELLELMFRPGFSTAESVSQLSGRGVGLDVVRSQVETLAGEVRVEAQGDGGGSTFSLLVPSSLVSDRGLLIQVGESVAVLGVNDVERVLLVEASKLTSVAGETVLELEDEDSLIVRDLAPMLGEPGYEDDTRTVVVVRHGRSRIGVLVSSVLGEERFVTKHLPWNLRSVAGVQGGVILPGGRVALVLDAAYLANTRLAHVSAAPTRAVQATTVPRIMVVDDSVTSRTLQRNILQSAGYEVLIAKDGEEGWQALQNASVDLVVSDVEMPRCTGLELAGRIRESDKLRELPVILVTSLGDEKDLAAGARAGADEYIVKGQFDQRQLLESVARLI